ncbi:MAG: radical SAM protein [Patescibacteria group bacterium]
MQKLNFLLVMPRLTQNVGDGYIFPLGVAYISSSMKKAGFNVFTLNLNHQGGDVFDVIKNIIENNNIDVVATGGISPQYHLVKSIIESARRVNSNIVTIVGGGIITTEPEIAMEALKFADFGVIGEGEITMCELAIALENSGNFSEIEGIIFKDGANLKRTNPRKDIENIGLIPWPDYEGFDIEKYIDGPSAEFTGLNKKRAISMMGSRSCPFNCTFCCHTTGKKYRQRPLDDFFAELDHLVSKYKIEYVFMADELFVPNFVWVKEFCDRIKEYNISWYASYRVDTLKPEFLLMMKDSGLNVLNFGLESADNGILKSMRKGITIEQIEKTLKAVYGSGIVVYGSFIFGDIEETIETARATLKWWREHSEYHIHLSLIKPFPGSYIYKYACQKGIIKDPIQYLKDGCPQVNISKMNNAEFAEVVRYTSESSNSSRSLDSVELLEINPQMGRETISAVCPKCLQKNTWENIKLFAINYIYCSNCGQKYDIPYPIQLQDNINKNISVLLEKYGKVAFWGMTFPVMNLFKQSKILHNKNVFAVDISESKRQMDLYGKKIYTPAILGKEDIRVVVIAVPSSGGQISCQIKENHPEVTEIIDICRLVDFNSVV